MAEFIQPPPGPNSGLGCPSPSGALYASNREVGEYISEILDSSGQETVRFYSHATNTVYIVTIIEGEIVEYLVYSYEKRIDYQTGAVIGSTSKPKQLVPESFYDVLDTGNMPGIVDPTASAMILIKRDIIAEESAVRIVSDFVICAAKECGIQTTNTDDLISMNYILEETSNNLKQSLSFLEYLLLLNHWVDGDMISVEPMLRQEIQSVEVTKGLISQVAESVMNRVSNPMD